MPTGDHKYKILQILEFDSTRKRMSVVIELEDGRLRLLSKGADSAIYDVLSSRVPPVRRKAGGGEPRKGCGKSRTEAKASPAMASTETQFLLRCPVRLQATKTSTSDHLDKFARAGLRTLCFGYRDIDPAFYRTWSEKFERANLVCMVTCTPGPPAAGVSVVSGCNDRACLFLFVVAQALDNRKAQLRQTYTEIEQDLILVGATGIEDKLQDGVPQAIADLRAAGLRVRLRSARAGRGGGRGDTFKSERRGGRGGQRSALENAAKSMPVLRLHRPPCFLTLAADLGPYRRQAGDGH